MYPLIEKEMRKKFKIKFDSGVEPVFVQCPAALIMLGDHTHYNDGIILSAAVNRFAGAAIKKRNDKKVIFQIYNRKQVYSIDQLSDNNQNLNGSEFINFKPLLNAFVKKSWVDTGFECLIGSDIPLCIGLGHISSHFLAVAMAIVAEFKIQLQQNELIELVGKSQIDSLGKITNKAHLFTSFYAKLNQLLKTDLRQLKTESIRFSSGELKVVIFDTGVKIQEAKDICTERIEECMVGVQGARLYIWGIRNLRDVNLDFLQRHFNMLPRRIYNRILYNVLERIRVEKAIESSSNKNLDDFGRLLYESHASLRHDYSLGSEQLDFLVGEAKRFDFVFGAKLISCSTIESTFNIVHKAHTGEFIKAVKKSYKEKFKRNLNAYTLEIINGVSSK